MHRIFWITHAGFSGMHGVRQYWFEGCEMLPNFGFTALMVLFGERVGMRTKLLGGNVLGSVVLMAACVCAAFSNENDQHSKKVAMFGATLGGVFLTGVTAALTNAGLVHSHCESSPYTVTVHSSRHAVAVHSRCTQSLYTVTVHSRYTVDTVAVRSRCTVCCTQSAVRSSALPRNSRSATRSQL